MNGFKRGLREFWAFYRLTNYGTATETDKATIGFDTAYVISLFFGISLLSVFMMNGATVMAGTLFAFFVTTMAVIMGINTRNKVNLVNVVPLSPRQRVLFTFLATLVRAIICTVVVVAVSWAFLGIVALVAYLTSGENIFVPDEEMVPMSAYGNALQALIIIFVMFSLMALSHLNKIKRRNITTGIFLIACFVAVTVMNTVFGAYRYGGSLVLRVKGDTFLWIDYLPHPWVPIVLASVLVVASGALAVLSVIKRYKSSTL